MTPRDLAFLKTIQERVQQHNAVHKQIKLVLSDSWSQEKNRYDYFVDVRTSLNPSLPRDKKSIDKAISIANGLNENIFRNGYAPKQHFCNVIIIESVK